ncbi:porin [Vibrio sp. NTOU-M3]|uniref:porin n=1 Tax=unclassified Vibrio TaxID=2614977 RepID=UPI00349FCFE8
MDKFFKVSALTAAMVGALAAMPATASTESAAGDQYVEKVNEFMQGSSLNAMAVVDTRSRTRNRGKDGDEVWSRLNYSSYNLIVDFTSGYHDDWLGADLAGYYSGDLYNDSQQDGDGRYLCNEISTCVEQDWGAGDAQQLKMYKAALKFKLGEKVDARLGMLQSNGNGALGNVWSFVPGTYRGLEVNADLSGHKFTYFAADQFTAPWLLHEDDYAPSLWSDTSWSSIHSIGLNGGFGQLNYQVGLSTALDVSYASDIDWGAGQVNAYTDKDDNTSYKVYAKYAFNDTTSLAFDFYGTDDDAKYDGLGYLTGLAFAKSFGKVSWNSELRYADSDNGTEVVPRTIYTYGMTNGNWSQWWDALSDWNQAGELSWYNRVSFNQGNGWNYYVGVGYGTGADEDNSAYESEFAVNGTVSYSLQSGSLKGATVRLHGTYLVRDEFVDQSTAGGFDETDLRLQVIIPYSFH